MSSSSPASNRARRNLLAEFAQNFFGYGNYCGQHWFIGMKEGGDHSFREIAKRLNAWADRGKRELEDSADYHIAIGKPHWFTDHPKLQSTWKQLIRIHLSSDAQSPTTEQVREYQRDSWGRRDGTLAFWICCHPCPIWPTAKPANGGVAHGASRICEDGSSNSSPRQWCSTASNIGKTGRRLRRLICRRFAMEPGPPFLV